VTAAKVKDAQSAAAAAEQLMQDNWRGTQGWAAAVDSIATEMAENRMFDEAVAIYKRLADVANAGKMGIADAGLASVLIKQRKFDEAGPVLDRLISRGDIDRGIGCGKLGDAYCSEGQYSKALGYYEKVVAANLGTNLEWGARSKVVECLLLNGDTVEAAAAIDLMLAACPDRKDSGKTVADFAGFLLSRSRYDAAVELCNRYASRFSDRRDTIWMDIWRTRAEIEKGSAIETLKTAHSIVDEAKQLKISVGEGICMLGQAEMLAGYAAMQKGDQAVALRRFDAAQTLFSMAETG